MGGHSTSYRPDIDGLRTLAVLAVVAYHAFPELVKGGFIGVDIFFVISGFLIGGIIFRAFESHAFSYADFYSRRIRRLFPALVLVLFSSFLFSWFVLLPDELRQLAKHTVGGVAFVANIVNWREAGYFDNAAETKPLLHLWSLGVEEQFYILFPIIVALAMKYRARYICIIIAVTAGSLAYSVHVVGLDHTAAFFSPVCRLWELMAGCLLAYVYLHKDPANFPGRPFASLAGPGLILAGVFYIQQSYAFPGALALLPVAGAFMVIYAGPDAWVNRHILGSRLFVAIGLISYPLYLWHWPLLSFSRILVGSLPPLPMRLLVVAASFILAWLTYRYVEVPARTVGPRRFVLLGSSALMVAIAAVGVATVLENGLPMRTPIRPYTVDVQPLYVGPHVWIDCPVLSARSSCWIVDRARAPSVALIGDSHASSLLEALGDLARIHGLNVVARVRYGCLPFYSLNSDPRAFHTCGDEHGMDAELKAVIEDSSIKTVIMTGLGFQIAAQNPSQFKLAMATTLSRLVATGKRIIFLIDVPSLTFDPKECLHRRPLQLSGYIREPCDGDAQAYWRAQAVYLSIVGDMEHAFPTVRFMDTSEPFVDKGRIVVMRDGKLMYNDFSHLTPAGARYLFSRIGDGLVANMDLPPALPVLPRNEAAR